MIKDNYKKLVYGTAILALAAIFSWWISGVLVPEPTDTAVSLHCVSASAETPRDLDFNSSCLAAGAARIFDFELETDTAEVTMDYVRHPENIEELADSIWMGWSIYESGHEDVWTVRGDGGHAYGRYQLDDRYLLADFFRFCVETDRERYEPFTTFYHVDSKGRTHLKNSDLVEENWNWMEYLEGEDFHDIQTRFVIECVYAEACASLADVCAELDQYSPVLHGTIASIAVRNGYYIEGLEAVADTYYGGIPEEEWLRAIYTKEARNHIEDGSSDRWARDQKTSALEALDTYDSVSAQALPISQDFDIP